MGTDVIWNQPIFEGLLNFFFHKLELDKLFAKKKPLRLYSLGNNIEYVLMQVESNKVVKLSSR